MSASINFDDAVHALAGPALGETSGMTVTQGTADGLHKMIARSHAPSRAPDPRCMSATSTPQL